MINAAIANLASDNGWHAVEPPLHADVAYQHGLFTVEVRYNAAGAIEYARRLHGGADMGETLGARDAGKRDTVAYWLTVVTDTGSRVAFLTITECGNPASAATSRHDTLADAHHGLARFARGYDIQGYGTMGGTLTTRSGRVNQASYVWTIRTIKTGN